jgi:hypothetical protein
LNKRLERAVHGISRGEGWFALNKYVAHAIMMQECILYVSKTKAIDLSQLPVNMKEHLLDLDRMTITTRKYTFLAIGPLLRKNV